MDRKRQKQIQIEEQRKRVILNEFEGIKNDKEYFSGIFQKKNGDRVLAKNALFNDSQNFKVLK